MEPRRARRLAEAARDLNGSVQKARGATADSFAMAGGDGLLYRGECQIEVELFCFCGQHAQAANDAGRAVFEWIDGIHKAP